jgi:hypothetical protein
MKVGISENQLGDKAMNWNQVGGKLKQYKGNPKRKLEEVNR